MRHGVAATAKQQPQVPAYGEEAPPRMMNDKKQNEHQVKQSIKRIEYRTSNGS